MTENKTVDALVKLNNTIAKKRNEFIYITGKPNDNGEIITNLQDTLSFDTDLDYTVSLVSANLTCFFPNITDANNNLRIEYTNSRSKI